MSDKPLTAATPALRFREARERLGLFPYDLAADLNISRSCVYDIEAQVDELSTVYSPSEIRKFCEYLRILPTELFGDKISEPPIAAQELVELIHKEVQTRGITLEEFEDIVGWRLSECIDPPDKLLKSLSVDGLQWLCREIRIDWRRAL